MTKATVQQFAAAVRKAHPEYNDVSDDRALAEAVVKAHPEYGDAVDFNGPAAAAAGGSQPVDDEKSLAGFAGNAIDSAGRLASDIGHAVTHPLDTLKAIKDVAIGGIEKYQQARGQANTLTGEQRTESIPAFDAMARALKNRYGSMDAVKRTAYEDPVGFLLDASSLMSGGAAIAERAGASSVATALRTAGELADPIRIAGKVVRPIAKGTGAAGAAVLGKTTGVGAEAIKTAARGGDAFEAGLRGATDHASAADEVLKAVEDVADGRRTAYQQQLAQLPSAQNIAVKPIYNSFQRGLDRLKVRVVPPATQAGEWSLDFSRSPLRNNAVEISRIQGAFDTLKDWGSRTTRNAAEIDVLKQQLGNLIEKGTPSAAALTATKNMAKQILETNVPAYEKMTADYAEASDLLNQIRSELSTDAPAGTRVRKVAGALNQRNAYRADLLDAIGERTGRDVRGAIAGADMNSWTPRGLMGPIAAEGALLHPRVIKTLGLTSPRLIGEILLAMSKAKNSAAGRALAAGARNPGVLRAATAAGAAGD